MGSNLSRTSGLGVGRSAGRSDQRQGRPYVSTDTDAHSTTQRNSFPAKLGASGYPVQKLANLDSRPQSTVAGRIGSDISDNWKNSEEEEYMWDTVDPRLRDHDINIIANARKNSWVQRDPQDTVSPFILNEVKLLPLLLSSFDRVFFIIPPSFFPSIFFFFASC